MPKLTHLDHIAIATHSLTESLNFFQNQLGLTCTHVEELPERGIRVAMLPIGDTRIELIEPLHDKSEVSSFLSKRGPGIHHLCFGSQNVGADMTELQSQGVPFTSDTPKPGAHDCDVAFIHPKASGGILVELSTPKAP
jgi:methylmalonyl-CoA epimerase